MALSSWLCINNARNMVVKIVYPGGRVELHDRPILAAEIMQQNPRCCITHPDVFRRPWAVVSPDTVLLLGQKFYVIPVSTLRKLRRRYPRNPNSPHVEVPSPSLTPRHQPPLNNNKGNTGTPKRLFGCLKQLDAEFEASLGGSIRSTDEMERGEHQFDVGCFKSMVACSRPKPGQAASDGMSCSMDDSSELKELNKKRAKENGRKEIKSSPERRVENNSTTPAYSCQPSLESIREE